MNETFDDFNDISEAVDEFDSNIYIDEADDSIYDRKTALNMCVELAQTEEELAVIKKYDDISSKLDSLREELHKLKAKIKLISLDTSRDTSQTMSALNGQRVILEKKIELADKKLIELEHTKALNDVILRVEKQERIRKAEAIKKARAEMREKTDDELRTIINDIDVDIETGKTVGYSAVELDYQRIRKSHAEREIERRERIASAYSNQNPHEPTKSAANIPPQLDQSAIAKINVITKQLSKETVQFALKNPHVKNLTKKNSFAFVDTVIVMCLLIDTNILSKFGSSELYSEYVAKYHSNVIHVLSNSSLDGISYAVINNMFANRLAFWRSFLNEKTDASIITDELLLMIDYDLLNNEYFEWSGAEPLILKDFMEAFLNKGEMMALLKEFSDASTGFEKSINKSLTAKKRQFHLRFHKFFIYFSIPLSILSLLSTLVSEWNAKKVISTELLIAGYSWEETYLAENTLSVEIFFLAVAIIFGISSIIGLHRFKVKGYISVYAYMISLLITRISVLYLYENLFPSESAQAWGSLFAQILFTVLVSIYYYKRRRIFIDGDTSLIK